MMPDYAYAYDSSSADAGGAVVVIFMILLYAAMIGFGFYMYWRIAGKAGWPGWYCLGLLVPFLNLVLMVMFAFKEWPVQAENRMLRQQLAYAGYGGGYGGLPQAPGYPTTQFGYPTTQPGYQPGYQATQPGYQPGYQAPSQGQQWDGPTA